MAGKADAIRLALKYSNIPFEDYKLKDGEFEKLQESGILPFGQVPALEVTSDNKKTILVQTGAILRFIAKLAPQKSLVPSCPIQACQVDALVCQETDVFQSARCVIYASKWWCGLELDNQTAQNCLDNINNEILPRHFENLERIIKSSPTKWIAGTDAPSIADFQWAGFLPAVKRGWSRSGNVLDDANYPELNKWLENFYDLPAVVEWYSQNPYKLWFPEC